MIVTSVTLFRLLWEVKATQDRHTISLCQHFRGFSVHTKRMVERVALDRKQNDDLSTYYKIWRNVYTARYSEIRRACNRLTKQQPYAIVVKQADGTIKSVTRSRIDELQRSDWFRERVFDMYLCNEGS